MEDINKKVQFLIERKRFSEAESVLANGLADHPEDKNLLYLSAVVDMAQDREEDAEKTLYELLQLDPENESGRYLLVRLRLDQNRLSEAEEMVLGLLHDYPDDPDYYTTYARIMLEAFQIEKAEKLASEALRLEPEDVDALTLSVICGVIRDDKHAAHGALAELMRNHPESRRAAWAILSVLEDKGHDKECLRLVQEMLRSDPGNEDFVEVIRELRVQTHPTMLPLWPMRKWGWHASAGLWIGFLIVLSVSKRILPPEGVLWVSIVWLGYAVYSWVYPPILKRVLR